MVLLFLTNLFLGCEDDDDDDDEPTYTLYGVYSAPLNQVNGDALTEEEAVFYEGDRSDVVIGGGGSPRPDGRTLVRLTVYDRFSWHSKATRGRATCRVVVYSDREPPGARVDVGWRPQQSLATGQA